MIIDAHVHLPVTGGGSSFLQKKERLLHEMARNHVDQCIVISDSYPVSEIGSMDECVTLFEGNETVHVVGGISPLCGYREQLAKLQAYLERRQVVGIKLFTGHEEFYLTDERLKPVYELALRYDVPVLFHSGGSQYGSVLSAIEVAGKYPKLRLVCCHCFYPHLEQCLPAVDVQNIFFDISSIADGYNSIPDLQEMLTRIIEKAPSRVLFGSDYGGCSQGEHIELVRGLHLEPAVREAVFWKNAARVYRLGEGKI